MDFYTIKVECINCSQYTGVLKIDKGTRIVDALRREGCPVCGCKTLSRVKELSWYTTNSSDNTISVGSCREPEFPTVYAASFKDSPVWICGDCGGKYGRGECGLATWHEDRCDICGLTTFVTEPRDFGGLRSDFAKLRATEVENGTDDSFSDDKA